MNFIERIKSQLDTPRNNVGRADILIDRRALTELIYHFEALDSDARVKHAHYNNVTAEEILSYDIQALHHKHEGNNDPALLVIAETLAPLIRESLKKKIELERINRSCTT